MNRFGQAAAPYINFHGGARPMRAEFEALVSETQQSIELLRRRL